MAYYYKGAKILAPISITSNEPVYDVDTVSLSKQRATQGAQRWELSFSTITSGDTEAEMLVGVVEGISNASTMVMPQLPSVDRVNTIGTSRPISAASAGASTVNVNSDGFTSKGTFVKFSNHAKVYMVTEDHSAGVSPMAIYPPLRSAVTGTDTITTGPAVSIRYYREVSNLRGLTYTDGILSSTGTINLVEALL